MLQKLMNALVVWFGVNVPPSNLLADTRAMEQEIEWKLQSNSR